MLRAVLEPRDLVATLGFLRSPLGGVPDRAWLPLWQGGFPVLAPRLGDEGDGAEGELVSLFSRIAADLDD